jgi:hypothetical protein
MTMLGGQAGALEGGFMYVDAGQSSTPQDSALRP